MKPFGILAVMGLALAMVAASPAQSQAAETPSAMIDRQADEIFALLKAGKALEAVDASIGRSALVAGKEAERQTLAAQIANALRIYGLITAVEKAAETSYGTMFVKRFYLVQHENMLTRWELNFSRLKTGWTVTYIGFEDQARSWE